MTDRHPAGRPRRRVSLSLLLWSGLCLLPATASAQSGDRVVIQAPGSSSRVTVSGEVLDWTGAFLRLRTGTGQGDQRYAGSEVISVQARQHPAHTLGIEHHDAGRFDQAEAAFEQALAEEPRQWMRREILALLIRCALRRDDFATAGMRFRLLYTSDPLTRHIHLIPLRWDTGSPGGLTRTSAIAWLTEPDAVARLLGASLLLFDPAHESAARDMLKLMQREPDDRLRQLAWWQQWRIRVAERQVGDLDIRRWEARLLETEQPLRAGPHFLIGQAFLVRQEFDLAAAGFLQVPLVYRSEHPLTADALLEAARALLRIGQRVEAARLCRELLDQYGSAPAAAAARTLLEQLVPAS